MANYTEAERLVEMDVRFLDVYLAGMPDQVSFAHPAFDELKKKAKSSTSTNFKAKIKVGIADASRAYSPRLELTRGVAAVSFTKEITREMYGINTPLKFIRPELFHKNFADAKGHVKDVFDDNMISHNNRLAFHLVNDADDAMLGRLVDVAGAYAAGDWIHVDAEYARQGTYHRAGIYDIHEPGNATANAASPLVIDDYDPDYAGGPAVKLNTAITIPAGGIFEMYGQASYGIGSKSVRSLIDPSVAYLGLTDTAFRPTSINANAQPLSLALVKKFVRKIRLSMGNEQGKLKELTLLLAPVHYDQLEEDIMSKRTLMTEKLELVGGFLGMKVAAEGIWVRMIQDHTWRQIGTVPGVNMGDWECQYWGPGLIYSPKIGGGGSGGGGTYIYFNPATSNAYVGDIETNYGPWAVHRSWHGRIYNVDTTPV